MTLACGHIYTVGGSTSQTLTGSGSWDKLTGWASNGPGVNVTTDQANNKLTPQLGGLYLVLFDCSFDGDHYDTYSFRAYVDGVSQAQSNTSRYIEPNTNSQTVGFATILQVSAGEDIEVYVSAAAASRDITPTEMHLTAILLARSAFSEMYANNQSDQYAAYYELAGGENGIQLTSFDNTSHEANATADPTTDDDITTKFAGNYLVYLTATVVEDPSGTDLEIPIGIYINNIDVDVWGETSLHWADQASCVGVATLRNLLVGDELEVRHWAQNIAEQDYFVLENIRLLLARLDHSTLGEITISDSSPTVQTVGTSPQLVTGYAADGADGRDANLTPDSANNRLVIERSGLYWVHFDGSFTCSAGVEFLFQLYRDVDAGGSPAVVAQGACRTQPQLSDATHCTWFDTLVVLGADDEIHMYASSDSAGNDLYLRQSHFWAVKLD